MSAVGRLNFEDGVTDIQERVKEIAYTPFGRNALLVGLISHVAAILVTMMSVSGGELFFNIVFPFSCLVLVIGSYAELKNRGYHPLRDWKFYVIAAVTVFPVLGPLIVLGLLCSFQKRGQEARAILSGLFSAILRLQANVLVLFGWIIFLFLLFAVIHSRYDPYFKKGPHGLGLAPASPALFNPVSSVNAKKNLVNLGLFN